MLEINIPKTEFFDDQKERFIYLKETKLQLEHSLISVRKWEAKYHKPFLGNDEKTLDEVVDYVRFMTLNKGLDDMVYQCINDNMAIQIVEYINDPHTATWFSNIDKIGMKGKNGEVITSEIIYYWMISLGVPVEFERWHLNQLLTLIQVINLKNAPKKKMSKREAAAQRAALNASRRARLKTSG